MKGPQEPVFLQSPVCFGGVIVTVIAGLLWLDISLHSLLLITLVWIAGHTAFLGFHFQEIKSAMISGKVVSKITRRAVFHRRQPAMPVRGARRQRAVVRA